MVICVVVLRFEGTPQSGVGEGEGGRANGRMGDRALENPDQRYLAVSRILLHHRRHDLAPASFKGGGPREGWFIELRLFC